MALFTIIINEQINQPPNQIGNLNLSLDYNQLYTFTIADFTTNTSPIYQDPEGDLVDKVKILTLPIIGEITLSGIPITALDEINKSSIDSGLLKYQADVLNINSYIDNNTTFDLSDVGSTNFSGLTPGIITFIVGDKPNEKPTQVGNNSLTIDYGVTIVFTAADFTTNTTPVYLDPEGDAAYQLKILTLPISGNLKLNGTNVIINQIINFSDINLGLLTYVPSLGDIGGVSRNFTFSISDTGSSQFTS